MISEGTVAVQSDETVASLGLGSCMSSGSTVRPCPLGGGHPQLRSPVQNPAGCLELRNCPKQLQATNRPSTAPPRLQPRAVHETSIANPQPFASTNRPSIASIASKLSFQFPARNTTPLQPQSPTSRLRPTIACPPAFCALIKEAPTATSTRACPS
ncbi:hypothetical protein GGTG_09604 [Gaeumannomyces tritici R3-111a-1]|uniref:Uncharacterized protein n=1 Tax=Gaeumannomyces tritici (strain R3-111a-1) TaxID=644352 RepID=J3P7W4_GAET3|nr:hypothetical protein GGTG_09604 [Gaeumannomyces tritici R3-111a-1]EJT72747.1 hypothetical protein GGTG_09604 [Gaeumannomyces tritici R3-111a-1]